MELLMAVCCLDLSTWFPTDMSEDTMTLSLYLGRGQISRGRTVIQKGLNMVVDTLPYGNANDLATVAIAIDHMAKALLTVPGLTYLYGPYATGEDPQCAANLTAAEFLASVSYIPEFRYFQSH